MWGVVFFLIGLAAVPLPAALADETSVEVLERRLELLARYERSSSPVEREAILVELRRLRAVDLRSVSRHRRGASRSSAFSRLADPIGLSTALGVGARLASTGDLDESGLRDLIDTASRDGLDEREREGLRDLRAFFGDRIGRETRDLLDTALTDARVADLVETIERMRDARRLRCRRRSRTSSRGRSGDRSAPSPRDRGCTD